MNKDNNQINNQTEEQRYFDSLNYYNNKKEQIRRKKIRDKEKQKHNKKDFWDND